MTSKERLICALERKVPDRLPVTTHHVMPYFTERYLDGRSSDQFFEFFGLDAIRWLVPTTPDKTRGDYFDPDQGEPGFLQVNRIISDSWRIESEPLYDKELNTRRDTIVTPRGKLSAVIQGNYYTEWVAEHLLKKKNDLEIIADFQTYPRCDVDRINREAEEFGDRGIIRGFIIPNDIYGQPGCWQDFCCMRGTEQAILDTYDDPGWVREVLSVILERKLAYTRSMKGARYDITELGGGDASTTVISPHIFHEFVAPYDTEIIKAAHDAGIRVAYHTCGGMMPILEDIAAMSPDAMETFTPSSMGGDVNLAEATKRIGDRVCMIGGFDQSYYFRESTPEETREQVRKCFEDAGKAGGYILSPSDHFFDADVELIQAFADEARKCVYT